MATFISESRSKVRLIVLFGLGGLSVLNQNLWFIRGNNH
uniref:Uncharacterized protein n=1 Tax=Anguilla anguilla TaxID=7936 RepID=A0A0E9VCG1_ANGAN